MTYNEKAYLSKCGKLIDTLTTQEQKQALNDFLKFVSNIIEKNEELDLYNETIEDALNFVCDKLQDLTGINWLQIKDKIIAISKDNQ